MSILSFLGGLVGIGPTRRTITISKTATNSGLPFVIGEARLKAISVFTVISRKNGPLGAANWDFKYDPRPTHGDEEVKGAREWLHRIDVFAQGPITSFMRFYVDSDAHTSARFGTRPYFRTVGYFGSATQSAFAWGAVTTKRGANHRGVGVAYAISRFYAHGKYPKYNSEPLVEAVIQGMALYDPRPAAAQTQGLESSYTYSENPSLGLLRYLTADTGPDWGFPALDVDSFKVAADFCDVAVAIPARHKNVTGGPVRWRNRRKGQYEDVFDGEDFPTNRRDQVGTSQSRIAGSFILDPEAGVKDNIEAILTVMHGHLPFSNGKYKLIIEDAVVSPAMAFDDDSILGNWKVADGGRKDRLNRATVTFINKNKSYKEDSVSWPKLDSATYTTFLAEDSGEKLHQTFDVTSIPDYYQAEDWAEFQVRNSRANKRVTVDLAPQAMVLEFGDVISLTSSARDWTAKWFRVRKITLKVDGTVTADLVEYDVSIYSWSTKTHEPLDDPGDAPFVWDTPLPLGGLAAFAFHDVNDDGSVVSGFNVSWTAPTDTAGLEHIEVAWKLAADLEYSSIMRVPPENTTARITGLADARVYDIRVTYRTSLGQISVSAEQTAQALTASGSRLGGMEDGATAGATIDRDLRRPIGGGAYVIVPQTDLLNSAISFPNLTLINPDGFLTISGNSAKRTSGTAGYNAQVYSKESFVGSAGLTWTTPLTTSERLMALNSDPALDASYMSLDYCVVMRSTGVVNFYEFGAPAAGAAASSYADGSTFAIIWDGVSVKYYVNDILRHTSLSPPATNARLYLDSSFFHVGGEISNIAFNQGTTILGDPFGSTENMLSIDAGPSQVAGHLYWDKEWIADHDLSIGEYVSFSGLASCTDSAATNVRFYMLFYTASDVLISQENGTLYHGVVSDVYSMVENVTIPPLTVKMSAGIGFSTGATVQVSGRKAMLNRGPKALKYVRAVEDGSTNTDNEAVIFGGNNNLFANGQFRVLAADGRPAGVKVCEGGADGTVVQTDFDASGNRVLRIASATDTSITASLLAFAVNHKSQYRAQFDVRCQDNGGSVGNAATGLYIRFMSKVAMTSNKKYIGSGINESNAEFTTDDARTYLMGYSNGAVTTSWVTVDQTVSLPVDTTFASLNFANWVGMGLRALEIRNLVVTEIAPQNVYELDGFVFDSFRRLANNERMPMLRNYSLGIARTSNPITASDGGATATISIAAHTVYNGDVTGRTYNAGSITGLAFSTGYTVYVDDPDYAAGTVTYVATTTGVNAGKNLGRYLIGTVITPADGSPPATGGGGGGFDCIAVGMWLTSTLQAKDLKLSSTLMFLTEIEGVANGNTYYQDHLESVDFSNQPCVEIETTGGAKLICSVSTPVTLRSGALIPVTESLGGELATLIDGAFEWQEVTRIDYVGECPVAHIHAGGRTFAAGAEARAKIFTHNAIKP